MAKISGGDKLNRALAKIGERFENPPSLQVGFMDGATYPDGTPVALVAAVNEFGAPSAGIPPRPFFRGMIAAKSAGWPKAVARVLKENDYDVELALRIVGEAIKGQLQQAIRDFNGVPLKPRTIARKGFDKQLIDTGHMLNSVDYEVKS